MCTYPIMPELQFAENFPELHRQVCDELGVGFVPAIFRCVAASNPDLALSSWNMVRKNLCSGSISRTTKELMFSYIAHKKKCDYCDNAHHALALHHGFDEENISTILDDLNNIRNPTLRAVIKFADLSVDKKFTEIITLDEELVDFGFSRDEITELIGVISCILYMINLADSLFVITDQKFLDIIAS